ncbi:MAG TPA: branched-chain amino acid ABC transporter permease [Beijerinckiaceae bacterium]|nr:branched-chain amino acid ABC transporter permease [Beijerinckiaceae bacterium]
MTPRNLLIGAIVIGFGLAAPFVGLYPVLLMKLLCFALFACAFNLLIGFVGLLSFGHAMFFGSAAYAAGHAMKVWGFTPELGLIFGVAVSALLGVLVGALAIRRQGIYFAMITMALAQMFYFFALQAPFTGGEDGLQGIPRGALFGVLPLQNDLVLYYVILAVVVGAWFFIARIVHSPFGQILKAIRENEPRTISLGYDTDRFKLMAFVLSAALAGLAGALKALVLGFATLSDVHWATSGSVILMSLIGGIGTLTGPVVGAFIITGLENILADRVGSWVTVVLGVIFVVSVLVFRQGLVGTLKRFWPAARTTAARA